jgi:acyl carrier protein
MERKIKEIMIAAGIQESLVADLLPHVSLKEQGFDSVDIPLVLIGVKEELGIDIPNKDVSPRMTLNDFTLRVLEKLETPK